jgi:hypothetical protein
MPTKQYNLHLPKRIIFTSLGIVDSQQWEEEFIIQFSNRKLLSFRKIGLMSPYKQQKPQKIN